MPAKPIARSFSARPGLRAYVEAGARPPCPLVCTTHLAATTGGPGSGNLPISSGKSEKNPELSFFFHDPDWLSRSSAGRSAAAGHRQAAAPSS